MNAVSLGSERHVNPVVDEHARAVRTRYGHGGARKFSELPRGKISFADLNKLTAGLCRRADERELLAQLIHRFSRWAERQAVGYQVE